MGKKLKKLKIKYEKKVFLLMEIIEKEFSLICQIR